MLPFWRAVKTLSLLKPTSDCFSLAYIYIFRKLSHDGYERARAVENEHFLKIQIDQLKELRNKMAQKTQLGENVEVTNEMKSQDGKADGQMETTKQADN